MNIQKPVFDPLQSNQLSHQKQRMFGRKLVGPSHLAPQSAPSTALIFQLPHLLTSSILHQHSRPTNPECTQNQGRTLRRIPHPKNPQPPPQGPALRGHLTSVSARLASTQRPGVEQKIFTRPSALTCWMRRSRLKYQDAASSTGAGGSWLVVSNGGFHKLMEVPPISGWFMRENPSING